MHIRLGAIFIWEEKITLNDAAHTIYRTEHRPEIIRASDCRLGLFKHLDANSDLYDQFIAEQIHAVRIILESKWNSKTLDTNLYYFLIQE